MKKILITGGHFTPALAVLNELKKNEEVEFVWVGQKFNQLGSTTPSAEYNSITEMGIKYIDLETGKLVRQISVGNLFYSVRKFIQIFTGFIKSIHIIYKEKPDMVLSFGGYIAVPIVLAAKIFKKEIITHEQTLVVGLANRIIGKFAHKILVSFENSTKYFDESKVVFTGNPIRDEVFSNDIPDFLKTKKYKILVMGGNQGSHTINQAVFKVLPDILKDSVVVHVTGSSSITLDYNYAFEIKNALKSDKDDYHIYDFIKGDLYGNILNNVDLVISRSGANSITEYLAVGKLSILIPLPNSSHNEQERNAELLKELGIAEVIEQENLKGNLFLKKISNAYICLENETGFNRENLKQCFDAAKSLVEFDAAKNISSIVLDSIK